MAVRGGSREGSVDPDIGTMDDHEGPIEPTLVSVCKYCQKECHGENRHSNLLRHIMECDKRPLDPEGEAVEAQHPKSLHHQECAVGGCNHKRGASPCQFFSWPNPNLDSLQNVLAQVPI
jgi:hypothetical protein